MHLRAIVENLRSLDGSLTIAMRKPWSETAECVLLYQDGTPARLWPKRYGYSYFLEIDVVREALAIFGRRKVSLDDKLRVILHYAANDAWPPWVADLLAGGAAPASPRRRRAR